jgi:hypothetical protein
MMVAKKMALLIGSALSLSAASVAQADYYDYRTNTYVREYPTYSYSPAPRVYQAPAPTYYSSPPAYSYYEPAPSYYAPAPSYSYAPSGTATGAIAGALIGGAIADRDHRTEGAVAGALLGGVIGSQSDRYSY